MGTNTMALIQTCQIHAIMTVLHRLSVSAQLTNCNVGPCWHVMAHIGACGDGLGRFLERCLYNHKKNWCPVSTFTCFRARFTTKTICQGAPLPTEHSKITILHGIGCSCLNLSISYYCSFVFWTYGCVLLSTGKQPIGKLCRMSGRPLLQNTRTEAIMAKKAQIQAARPLRMEWASIFCSYVPASQYHFI